MRQLAKDVLQDGGGDVWVTQPAKCHCNESVFSKKLAACSECQMGRAATGVARERKGSRPVEVPDALSFQLLTGDGMCRSEVPKQPQSAVSRYLPDAEEAQDMIYPICVEVSAHVVLFFSSLAVPILTQIMK